MRRVVKAWAFFKDHPKRGPVLYGCFLGKRRYQLLPGWYWKRITIAYDAPRGTTRRKRKAKGGG